MLLKSLLKHSQYLLTTLLVIICLISGCSEGLNADEEGSNNDNSSDSTTPTDPTPANSALISTPSIAQEIANFLGTYANMIPGEVFRNISILALKADINTRMNNSDSSDSARFESFTDICVDGGSYLFEYNETQVTDDDDLDGGDRIIIDYDDGGCDTAFDNVRDITPSIIAGDLRITFTSDTDVPALSTTPGTDVTRRMTGAFEFIDFEYTGGLLINPENTNASETLNGSVTFDITFVIDYDGSNNFIESSDATFSSGSVTLSNNNIDSLSSPVTISFDEIQREIDNTLNVDSRIINGLGTGNDGNTIIFRTLNDSGVAQDTVPGSPDDLLSGGDGVITGDNSNPGPTFGALEFIGDSNSAARIISTGGTFLSALDFDPEGDGSFESATDLPQIKSWVYSVDEFLIPGSQTPKLISVVSTAQATHNGDSTGPDEDFIVTVTFNENIVGALDETIFTCGNCTASNPSNVTANSVQVDIDGNGLAEDIIITITAGAVTGATSGLTNELLSVVFVPYSP